jgi:hypothetical protein
MKKLIFIADYFEDEIIGGGEKCNSEIIQKLSSTFETKAIKSSHINLEFLKNNKNSTYIIGNFLLLSFECKEYLQNNCRYFIYEHDHKYLKSRNPALYRDYLIPKQELINLDFFKNAKLIICQTNFHANIVKKNLEFDNIVSASTNFWSKEEKNILLKYSKTQKKNIAFILDTNIEHKNALGSIEYCNKNNLKYFTFQDFNFENFIKNISKADKFIFFPKTPETFGRVATECKILGMKIHTNGLLGVSHENWFKELNGIELLNYIEESNDKFLYFLKENL